MLKRVTSRWALSPRHCTRVAQLLLKKCRSGGKRCWQHCVKLDRIEISASELCSRYERVTARPTGRYTGKVRLCNV